MKNVKDVIITRKYSGRPNRYEVSVNNMDIGGAKTFIGAWLVAQRRIKVICNPEKEVWRKRVETFEDL